MIGFFWMIAAVGVDARCAANVGLYQSPRGVISTPRIATQVARTYFDAIYGADTIARELPLRVSISHAIWRVEGSLPPNHVGGVAEIELCQSNGQVLRVIHGK